MAKGYGTANKRHRARTEIRDGIKTAVPAGERPRYKQVQKAPSAAQWERTLPDRD